LTWDAARRLRKFDHPSFLLLASISSVVPRLLRSSPLRHDRFRLFYIGSVGTALGYTMQATVAAWLMATLTPSALMVALVQTASTAPSLLLGLLAGSRRISSTVAEWFSLRRSCCWRPPSSRARDHRRDPHRLRSLCSH
jgi:hypothetical protein